MLSDRLLHAAWALLFSVTVWPYVASRARPLLVAYPIAMALTLVYTGEHYVIDIVIGWCYVLGAVMAENRLRPWETRAVQRVRKNAGFSTSIG